jgi:hypothetical protein
VYPLKELRKKRSQFELQFGTDSLQFRKIDEMVFKREALVNRQETHGHWVEPKVYEDAFCLPAMDTYYD